MEDQELDFKISYKGVVNNSFNSNKNPKIKDSRNNYTNRIKFSKQLRCNDITEAIKLCNGSVGFDRRFRNEFLIK